MENIFQYINQKQLSSSEFGLYKKILTCIFPVYQQVMSAGLVSLNKPEDLYLWHYHSDAITEGLGLQVKTLYETKSRTCLLFYEKQRLTQALYQDDVLKFLVSMGYSNTACLEDMLDTLRERYSMDEFPHEIGLFLGYPLKDVIGFIEHKGKNFKACKYWKVYDSLEFSIGLFNKIDMARDQIGKILTAV